MSAKTLMSLYPDNLLQKTTRYASRKILRIDQVKVKIGLSRSTIYSRLNPNSRHYDPLFPKPIHLGIKAVAWIEAEIDAWLQSRIDLRQGSGESAS